MASEQIKEQRHRTQQGKSEALASGSVPSTSSTLGRAEGTAQKLGSLTKGVNDTESGMPLDQARNTLKTSEKPMEELGKIQQTKGTDITNDVPKTDLGDTILDLSNLDGLEVRDGGKILDERGQQIGEVVEGDPEDLVGQIVHGKGEILDEDGDLIGRVNLLPRQIEGEQATTAEKTSIGDEMIQNGPILKGKTINKEGKVLDEESNVLGEVVGWQDPSILAGKQVNEKGQILDDDNTVIGQVQITPGKTTEAASQKLSEQTGAVGGEVMDATAQQLPDISALQGLTCNKLGLVVNQEGVPVGQLVEGDAKKLCRAGLQLDNEGQFWDNRRRVVGRVIPLAVEQEEAGVFADLGELLVVEGGWVQDENRTRVGKIVEGDVGKLIGRAVDNDGDILDKRGNVLGHAEPYEPDEKATEEDEGEKQEEVGGEEEAEVEEEDLSILDGKTVNKLGNVVDEAGMVFGRLVAGNPKKMAGKKVDGKGQIWNDTGEVVGMAELVENEEREQKEGIFFGLDGLVLAKGGQVTDPAGQVVGRLVEGDEGRLVGRAVDEDGEILDKSGNVIGRAERWTPAEKQRDISPMAGYKVNQAGEVRNAEGEMIGKLTQGNLESLVGKTVDDNGYVVDNDGQKIGECTLLEHMPAEPSLSPEEIEQQQKEKEERDLAKKMCAILQQTLDSVGGYCRSITQHIEAAKSTPKEDLDEEKLVKNVQPLIEEAAASLQECKSALRALDPDGQIAATAKARSASHEAAPEEYQLADLLKELTEAVVETIENGRRMIADMPHAKRKLNPMWVLLSEPLFQIIAAIGLLLSGVLGIVNKLLSGLGLGGLLQSLLGGLGIDKLLEGFGLGTVTDALGLAGKKSPVSGSLGTIL